MKKILKIALLLQIVLLYCCLPGAIRIGAPVDIRLVTKSSDGSHNYSVEAQFLIHDSAVAGNSVRGFNPLSFFQKHKLPSFWSFRKLAELTQLNNSSRYQFYVKNLIQWFCPTDIIFPFHYFW